MKNGMKKPKIHPSAFIAPGASIYGDVTIGGDCSVWFHAVVRGENAGIFIGDGSNIQDNCVVHVDPGHTVEIGRNVTVGHGAIVHGCKIGDNTLVGMGAILLNGAAVGKNCIIGAGALITQSTVIPDNSLVIGSPAKVTRKVTPQEAASNMTNARHYVEAGKEYAAYLEQEHAE